MNRTSFQTEYLAEVWKDSLQQPVMMSQVLITPAESLETTMPSFVCRLTDKIRSEVSCVDSESVATGFVDEALICQNLIAISLDDEIRKEENVREVIEPACPEKDPTR